MNLEFDPHAIEDLEYWAFKDKKILKRIFLLLKELSRDPYHGRGKPEPLKYELSGCLSRRINQEHRVVYKVENKKVIILSCRYHY